jgi:hypothetical protein
MATAKPRGRRRPAPPAWRRQWPLLLTVAVIVIAIGGFAYLAAHQPQPVTTPDTTGKVVALVTSPKPGVASAIGTGGLSNPLKPVPGLAVLRDASNKPEVLYIGAEYCPFCAAERWSLVYALSRFGTFKGLELTTSSSTDAYPDTPTFSFRSASFQSSVIAFSAVETSDRQAKPLQTVSASQHALVDKLDPAGSIPFLDVGNLYYEVGGGFVPDVLSGLSWEQIAAKLGDPNSDVARRIVGNANYLTAGICRLTDDQPAATCGDPAISGIEVDLG